MPSKHRLDVEVLAKHGLDASVTPLAIKLADGRRLHIDKIDDVCATASRKAGGQGMRYLCYIDGKQVVLFQDAYSGVWFCEL